MVRTSASMKPWQGILFGLIFAIIGAAVLWFAVSSIKTYNDKNETFKPVVATVVDYNQNDEGLQAIVVEYKVDGEIYRKASNSYSNMPKSIGSTVDVKYNPLNPKDAIWVNDSTNIVMPLFGGVFTLIGIIIMISSAIKMKNKEQYM